MNAPPFEVADIVRAAGKSFIEKNRSRLNLAASSRAAGYRALPHGRARRPSGSVRSLRASRPSRITRVETAIAASARPTLVTGGSEIVKRNC